MSEAPGKFTLVTSCPDQVGLVAAVSSFIAERGGCLVESAPGIHRINPTTFSGPK